MDLGAANGEAMMRKDDILGFLIRLDHLRRGIERAVPQARAFIRPGLDEPVG